MGPAWGWREGLSKPKVEMQLGRVGGAAWPEFCPVPPTPTPSVSYHPQLHLQVSPAPSPSMS